MSLASTDFAVVERLKTNSRIFAQARLDAISIVAALLHCAYFFGMFYLFPAFALAGAIYGSLKSPACSCVSITLPASSCREEFSC
jgi:hypothetical protein